MLLLCMMVVIYGVTISAFYRNKPIHAEHYVISKILGFTPDESNFIYWLSNKKSNYKIDYNIKKKSKKIQIIVIRWNGHRFVNSKPCINCINFMKFVGIKEIYYSNNNGDIVSEKIKNITTSHKSSFNK